MFAKAVLFLATTTAFAVAQVPPCPKTTLDFDTGLTLARGDTVTGVSFPGFMIAGLECTHDPDGNGSIVGNGCRIFDTAIPAYTKESGNDCECPAVVDCWLACPVGTDCKTSCAPPASCETNTNKCGDTDLFPVQSVNLSVTIPPAGLGMILILEENADNSLPPDDDSGGGTMTFEFTTPMWITGIGFVDTENTDSIEVKYLGTGDSDLGSVNLPITGDSGYGEYNDIDVPDVLKLEINIVGSGALASITYIPVDSTCAGGGGDPHFSRWNQPRDTFHGECDLVMVHSDDFHAHAGLDLHVRTTTESYFSYMEAAALRLGPDVLEIHRNNLQLNGVKYHKEDFPLTFGEGEYQYTYSLAQDTGKRTVYKLTLGSDESWMEFKFFYHFMTVAILGKSDEFADSVGLLGSHEDGSMVGREGAAFADFEAYAFEWQVDPHQDPQLFHAAREPQLPFERCRMPSEARPSRRKLRSNGSLFQEAQAACAKVAHGNDMDLCVDDIMATGEVGLAEVW